MNRLFLAVSALVLSVLLAAPSRAAITFGDVVDIDLSSFGAGILDNVTAIDFGTTTDPTSLARFALNIDNVDGSETSPGSGIGTPTPGDTTKLVGHVNITNYNTTTASSVSIPGAVEFTAIIELEGVLASSGSFLVNDYTGGFLKLFIDETSSGTFTTFDIADVNDSADGTLVAEFDLFDGRSVVFAGGSFTLPGERITALLDQPTPVPDFFTLSDGTSLTSFGLDLFLGIRSSEEVITSGLAGINATGSDPGPVDIGSGFTPTVPANLLDVFLASDGSSSFAIVPEATSLLLWGGFGCLVSVARTRRRV